MSATTTDRNTFYKDVQILGLDLAAGVSVLAGTIAVLNADGFGQMGDTAADLIYVGCFEESVDNTTGADGDVKAKVRREKAFNWENDDADPVTQAELGQVCYIVDNQTVAATNDGGTRSAAGVVWEIDADGSVWVK